MLHYFALFCVIHHVPDKKPLFYVGTSFLMPKCLFIIALSSYRQRFALFIQHFCLSSKWLKLSRLLLAMLCMCIRTSTDRRGARLQEVSPGLGLQPEPDIPDQSAESAPSQRYSRLSICLFKIRTNLVLKLSCNAAMNFQPS
jgi:hypothetical protein